MFRPSNFTILMIFTLFTVIGLSMVPRLSIQLLPTTQQRPGLQVLYHWPHATPEVIEREVTAPLEGLFSLIPGIQNIHSTSKYGSGTIQLQLEKGSKLDYLRFEIAAKIRQLYPELPPAVSYPKIIIQGVEEENMERPILTYSLIGYGSSIDLQQYAKKKISPQLALNPGIQRIDVIGGHQLEWMLYYDSKKLALRGIQLHQIERAIRETFGSEALGITREGQHTLFVNLQQQAGGREINVDWSRIPIVKQTQRLVLLGELAEVEQREAPVHQYYRINGKNSIRLLFFPTPSTNTLRLSTQVKNQMEALQKQLPAGSRLIMEDDATEFLRIELSKIRQRTLWSLGILFLFLLLIYRNGRYLLTVLLSLTVNLGLASICYYFAQVELQLYALAGITVSFGLIIDNTIVMIHHLKEHQNLRVLPALLAGTLTTISALVVIYFLPEQWQNNLLGFGKVLIINLGISLVVARWFIPAMIEKLSIKSSIRRKTFSRRSIAIRSAIYYQKSLRLLLRFRPMVLTIVILTFGLPVFLLPQNIAGWKWYNNTIGSEWYREKGRPVVNQLLGGTLRLFSWNVYNGASYREPEETVLHIAAKMPLGATLDQMDRVCRRVESLLEEYHSGLEQYVTQVRSGQHGEIRVHFSETSPVGFPHQLKNQLEVFVRKIGGVKWNIFGVGQAFSNEGMGSPPSYRIALYGYHSEKLANLAETFAQKLKRHPRVKKVNTAAKVNWWERDLYLLQMKLDRQAFAFHSNGTEGLQPLTTLLHPFNQTPRSTLLLPGGNHLRSLDQQSQTNDLWSLKNQHLSLENSHIKLSQFSAISKQKSSSALHKENQEYVRVVEFEFLGNNQFGERLLETSILEMKKELPLGFSIERQGNSWRQQQASQQFYRLLPLVIALIFLIAAVQFESLRQALAIVCLIPLSFIGIFLTFYLFDFPFDQGGYTSFIMVSGLVVNSLILILNDFNGLRKEHPLQSSVQIFSQAYRQKITPIFLSVLSTALGLLPFTLYGKMETFWFSFAVGTIGGMLFSLLVISYVSPPILVETECLKEGVAVLRYLGFAVSRLLHLTKHRKTMKPGYQDTGIPGHRETVPPVIS